MKWNLTVALAALAALGLVPTKGTLEVGKPPPEINGKSWLNHLGTDPTLASLKGQAVLIEFWATW